MKVLVINAGSSSQDLYTDLTIRGVPRRPQKKRRR